MLILNTIAGALLANATPATDTDKLFDATDPAAVAAALMNAGYKAELKTEADDTYILSGANGQSFTIEFYGCKDKHCSSLQFASFYDVDPLWTVAFANEWNRDNRFLKVAVDAKGQLHEYLDVSTIGKLTQANFADVIDWYQVMDGELSKFIDKARDAAKAKTTTKK